MTQPDAERTRAGAPLTGATPVWCDGAWQPLPALEGDVEADVCVVGLGGSGLACVHELLRLGARVVGVDASGVGAGAAGRNGGFLLAGSAAFHHDAVARLGRERACAIYRLTLAEIERMAAETPEQVVRAGTLRIADSDAELDDCAVQLAAMRADALPVEPYEGPEGRGLLLPTDGALQPLARCRVLARRALDAGARLYERSPAVAIETGVVRVPHGHVRCRHVVVAVDGRLETVLPELRGRVRSVRLQMLASEPAPEVRIPRPVYARWGYDYWQQLPDGRVAVGGGRDLGGDAEWVLDGPPAPVVQETLERLLRTRLGVRAAVSHRWAAIVGYTADHRPVAEEVRPGVWALGAYSGTGNVVGALLGRGVAQAVVRGDSPLLAPFRDGG